MAKLHRMQETQKIHGFMKWCTIIMLINNYCTSLHETMNHPQIMETVHKTVNCKITCCHSFDTVVNCFIILGLLQRTTKM